MSNTYSIQSPIIIDGKLQGYLTVIGCRTACVKCGRKILVEQVVNGSNHNSDPIVVCADCLEISVEYKEKHPQIAQETEAWCESRTTNAASFESNQNSQQQ